ncbi:MAG: hypothetical protein K8823_1518 [Cenarchaeum symbiont of Oopsacas minuta]|nr:hypothetical protein [Cenarchaeum symbiont of Oopsacas minuta]
MKFYSAHYENGLYTLYTSDDLDLGEFVTISLFQDRREIKELVQIATKSSIDGRRMYEANSVKECKKEDLKNLTSAINELKSTLHEYLLKRHECHENCDMREPLKIGMGFEEEELIELSEKLEATVREACKVQDRLKRYQRMRLKCR